MIGIETINDEKNLYNQRASENYVYGENVE